MSFSRDRWQDVPVLVLTFNRPDTTKKVMDALAHIQPKAIYIAQDGARFPNEQSLIDETRKVCQEAITRECDVHTLYRERNLWCLTAVTEGIDRFFEHVPAGIILEDDCVPDHNFFEFCAKALPLYQDAQHVWLISWSNYMTHVPDVWDYFFSKHAPILRWWATWKRAWDKYALHTSLLTQLSKKEISPTENSALHNRALTKYMLWGYRDSNRYAVCYFLNMYSIVPSYNLISNIWYQGIHNDRPWKHHWLPVPDKSIQYEFKTISVSDSVSFAPYDTYIKHYITRLMISTQIEHFLKKIWLRDIIKKCIVRISKRYYSKKYTK